MSWWPLIALSALGLGGLLSTLQHALMATSRVRLEELAERAASPRKRRRIGSIVNDIEGHVASVALPRIALNLTCVIATALWIRDLRGVESMGWPEVTIGVAGSSVVIWVLSLVIPLAVAEHAAEPTVYSFSGLIRLLRVLLLPTRPVFTFTNEAVRRLSGSKRMTAADDLQEELLSVVEEGEREGQLDETERDMIESVVTLRSTTVEQVMTPRTDVVALQYTDDLAAVKSLVAQVGHSRIPVYEETLDHIVGVLYAKDLLRWMVSAAGDGPFRLRPLLREATFVPETKTVRQLLSELLAAKVHIAIVADEYGGTSGVVTIEDIVEEIFGEIQDEYEPDEQTQSGVEVDAAAGLARLDARLGVHEANDALEPLGIEIPDGEDYDTLGGFVVVSMGRIPEPGDTFSHNGFEVSVLEAGPTRVKRVELRVAVRPEPAAGVDAPG